MSSYRFEEDFLNSAYERARRFDEGEICQSEEYDEIYMSEAVIFCSLIDKYGKDIAPLLHNLGNALYEEIILRNMHFFREGYLAALGLNKEQDTDEE